MKSVLVGMSGGVDSAAAALLLSRQGYETAGATLVLHHFGACGEDVENASKTAETLSIPFFVVEGEECFFDAVIRPFGEAYVRGETPNPCVLCNRTAKFPLLLQKADALSFDYIATGHYVRKEYDAAAGRYFLRCAADAAKDQSYVLYSLDQATLARCLFPMGTMEKKDVRALAARYALAPADRPESQDICFVPDGDYAAFLERTLSITGRRGDFLDESGRALGHHNGHWHYTIGQRRGLGVSAAHRLFVLSRDVENNTVTLGGEERLFSKTMRVRQVNWMAIAPPKAPVAAKVKARYRQPAQDARVIPLSESEALVEFSAPQRALTSGQSAVFYSGDAVLGGGVIE